MRNTFILVAIIPFFWACSENTANHNSNISDETNTAASEEARLDVENIKTSFYFTLHDHIRIQRSDMDFKTEHPKVEQAFLDQYIKTTPLFKLYNPTIEKLYKPTSSEYFHWGKIMTEPGIIHLILEKNIYNHDGGGANKIIGIFMNENGEKVNAQVMAYQGIVGGDFTTTLFSQMERGKFEQYFVDSGIDGFVGKSDTIAYSIDSTYKSFTMSDFGQNISLVDSSSSSFKKYELH